MNNENKRLWVNNKDGSVVLLLWQSSELATFQSKAGSINSLDLNDFKNQFKEKENE